MGLLDSVLGQVLGGNAQGAQPGGAGGLGGLAGALGGLLASNQNEVGGLGGLVSKFEQAGLGNVVDSWIGPETLAQLAAFAPWDMVLWPFQTMREIAVIAPSQAQPGPVELPDDWVPQLRALAPRYIVPSSCQFVQEDWSWYNHAMFPITYRRFADEIGAALPEAHIFRLDPSTSVLLDAHGVTPATPLPWVIPVGPQDVDFDYRPEAPPPATADIARRFAPLGDADAALVLDFCRHGLLERYRDMELPEDSYFQQPRLWRLSLYGHNGAATVLHYRTHGDLIDLVPDTDEAPGWTTEVPLVKCHAALVLGESLTSMYMRINDGPFDAEARAELDEADIVDDPLIRCLFNVAVGAYQAAQLERLGVKNLGVKSDNRTRALP